MMTTMTFEELLKEYDEMRKNHPELTKDNPLDKKMLVKITAQQ